MITEDNSTVEERQKIFSLAGRKAVQVLKMHKLPITSVIEGKIVKAYSDGHTEVLGTVEPPVKVVQKVYSVN